MKRLLPLVAAALLTLTLAGSTSADARTPRVDRRQACQHGRIQQGVRTGSLTPHEAMRLRRGQAKVSRMEWRAKADGRITRAERVHLQRMQDFQSQRIWMLKHNHRV